MPRTKPTWQQATALVSLSTCGAMTGFAFAHGTVGEMTSPTRMPVKLMALNKPAAPAQAEQTGDRALRSAIVKVAKNYLRMAQSKSPAEMEALIWGVDSVDGSGPRRVLRRLRQPHPRDGRSGHRAAELGHRGDDISVAAAPVGRRSGRHQS